MPDPSFSRPVVQLLTLGAALSTALLIAGLSGCPASSPANPAASGNPGPKPVVTTISIDDDACDHFAKGPIAAVTATPTDTAGPVVSNPHTRFDIALPGGNQVAYVTYTSSRPGDYFFYANKAVPYSVVDDSRQTITPKQTANMSGTCGPNTSRQQLPLSVGRYVIKLGPTPETSVSLVAIAADDAGNEK